MTKKLDKEEAYRFIIANNATQAGRIFAVTFEKREDGSTRTMRARLQVKRGVTGAGRNWEAQTREEVAAEYYLLTAFDVDKVVVYESASPITREKPGKVVATFDADGSAKYSRKSPPPEVVAAVNRLQRIGLDKVGADPLDLGEGYHAERGAWRNIPLDSVTRIAAGGEVIEAA